MNREEFDLLNIDDKVKYLNNKLAEGQTVTKIREELGIGEKALQRQIKEGGYKYNNKTKNYIKTTSPSTRTTTNENKVVNIVNKEDVKYISENIDLLKEIIENYKNTKAATQSTTGIVVNLISDRHLDTKPRSVRINYFVWEDWKEFCERNKYYSKQDLLSMALKEYMEKYND